GRSPPRSPWGLRRRRPAAPLKRYVARVRLGAERQGLRRRRPAAPLKLNDDDRGSGPAEGLRRRRPAAPLKQQIGVGFRNGHFRRLRRRRPAAPLKQLSSSLTVSDSYAGLRRR